MIVNRKALIKNTGCKLCAKSREIALLTLESGLKAANPEKAIKNNVERVCEKTLKVRNMVLKGNNIYVVGFGKASGRMAKAIEKVLRDSITEGIIALPKAISEKYSFKKIKIIPSSHPIPDYESIHAGKEILNLASKAKEGDILIVLISGGGSALAEYLRPGISLEDLKTTTNLLLKSGATISEINTIRKHISLFKGGWLAKSAYPATTVSLIISDVVGDPVEFIASGPTAPDTTTFRDAYNVLIKYDLLDKIPETVRETIIRGINGLLEETPKPKDEVFHKVHNIIIASNSLSLKAMKEFAEKKYGLNTLIISSRIRGEARHVGAVLASVLEEIYYNNRPVSKPAIILAGGETTVTVTGSGKGGRNQEVTLAASKFLKNLHGVVFLSAGSDGIDGVTDVAGGIIDAHTIEKTVKHGINIDLELKNNNSYHVFKSIGDYIYTGPTGTNVNDLIVGVVLDDGK